jgi:hypothetical protein
LELEGK